MPLQTTCIGAYPKPDYVPITDWFQVGHAAENYTDDVMRTWKPGDEPKIAAAIIELFHLLPPSSSFLEKLVTLTISLEGLLMTTSTYSHVRSPYRQPLIKFLNRYAAESIDFFLERWLPILKASLF